MPLNVCYACPLLILGIGFKVVANVQLGFHLEFHSRPLAQVEKAIGSRLHRGTECLTDRNVTRRSDFSLSQLIAKDLERHLLEEVRDLLLIRTFRV